MGLQWQDTQTVYVRIILVVVDLAQPGSGTAKQLPLALRKARSGYATGTPTTRRGLHDRAQIFYFALTLSKL